MSDGCVFAARVFNTTFVKSANLRTDSCRLA